MADWCGVCGQGIGGWECSGQIWDSEIWQTGVCGQGIGRCECSGQI
jgi:hypothetical protein